MKAAQRRPMEEEGAGPIGLADVRVREFAPATDADV
jgi:hypothetical protein